MSVCKYAVRSIQSDSWSLLDLIFQLDAACVLAGEVAPS